jgi:hypothetical protein
VRLGVAQADASLLVTKRALDSSSAGNKSFFASFFSKKEDVLLSYEKEAKRLLFLVRGGRGKMMTP